MALGPSWSPCLRSLPYQSSPALLQKCLPEMYQSLLCHTELKLCNIINRVWCGHYPLLYLVSFPVFLSSNNTNYSSNLRIPLFFLLLSAAFAYALLSAWTGFLPQVYLENSYPSCKTQLNCSPFPEPFLALFRT